MCHGIYPAIDWRMSHELGAADHGFVWPMVIFASDGDMMQVWAGLTNDHDNQSIRYLNSMGGPAFIKLRDFQREAENFINTVLSRLDAKDCPDTNPAGIWGLIHADKAEQDSMKYRRIEAMMGYDPDECPEELINDALNLENRTGEDALSELIPIYGKTKPLRDIEKISDGHGLIGAPEVRVLNTSGEHGMPWQRAVTAAEALRRNIGDTTNMVNTATLCELLGLKTSDVEQWSPEKRNDAALAIPESGNHYKFIPRKKHPLAKRFELARFIGDCILTGSTAGKWLTSTDLSTSRQKFQRAFAAEFLCPIMALREFLQDDFSESAIEDAVTHFQVSETTVTSLLANNCLIPFTPMPDYMDGRLPYHSGI